MNQIRDDIMSGDRCSLVLFSSFAAVALLLAALGIYGVMAFSVAQRSHEIALRMALSATRPRVIALVLYEGLLLAGIGLVLGLVGAYYVWRAMQSILFGVKPLEISAFAAVGAVVLATSLLACWLPAQMGAGTELTQVLRTE